MIPRALTIAGSDSGGGAGIQADLKTFHEHVVFGMSAITALTAQDTTGVHEVHAVPPAFVRAQIDAVASDLGVEAAKTGMLGSAAVVDAVADGIAAHEIAPLVVDPVCASKHGDPLLDDDAIEGLRQRILPLAEVVTPNVGEVAVLTGVEVRGVGDLSRAAEAVLALGPRWALVKGGHLPDNPRAIDLLTDGRTSIHLEAERLDTQDTHGTGCTLAAAIAARRARGESLEDAVHGAKAFVTGAIRHGLRLGKGIGPVDHAWARR
ncbi:bifunctional hydroxymethylpyrimidine kinase/phosphomethylpyrimidine kinase [Egibacter rhizosphaerae]|uniref:Bifunctional hydroxymethylpyrimidine kinase/phosphomethylpyrimidine kinase n=1 Tax=Egibacter rhizosphaerae TaxID=1670831 RepID=A0A411YCV4_9ACTN|nr:bifunctional hydroxymethylpyrimidine kinase/phosphomethylpyrimidine kinase [Egibacter rhizosphaerae]QBI18992.1 bifunctional hydroxymethylpyrimidine kinase/phosphomethylpyrimidine kinase [Egibacter rhizosphaerae]